MSYELKPCPFCGGKAEFRSGSSTTPYIRCRECGGRTKSSYNEASLIVAWNRRTELQANAKLREMVRDYERCSLYADCGRCEYDGTTSTHCPLSPCFPDIDELNELGVEVD